MFAHELEDEHIAQQGHDPEFVEVIFIHERGGLYERQNARLGRRKKMGPTAKIARRFSVYPCAMSWMMGEHNKF